VGSREEKIKILDSDVYLKLKNDVKETEMVIL